MTKITLLNSINQPSVGLPQIVLPTDDEMLLYADARVKNWWRASAGFDAAAKKWYCRKTKAALIPTRTVFPTRINAAGQVTAAAIGAGGAGYTAATVTFADPPAGGIRAKGIATVAGGAVTGITITHPGAGYAAAPAVTIGGDGAGATATSTIDATDKYNGHKCLMFENGAGSNGSMYDGGQNLLPTNADFSVVFVGRQGPGGDAGYMWGSGVTGATAGGVGVSLGIGGAAGFTLQASNSNLVNNTTSAVYANGPFIAVSSIADSADTAHNELYPAGYGATLPFSNAIHVTNAEFHVGDDSPVGVTNSAAHYIEGGSLAEIMIINAALHLPTHADLLARLKSVLSARYAISVG